MPAAKIREEQILNFNADVIAAPLTGFVSGSGTLSATDTILQVTNKLDGNDGLRVLKTTTVAGFALSGNVTLANLTNSTGITGGSYNGSTTVALSIDQTFTPSWTGAHTYLFPSIGTGSTDAILLSNVTASTNVLVQSTPSINLGGTAWSTGGAVSIVYNFRLKGVGVTGATGFAQFAIQGSTGGGAYSNLMLIDTFGSVVIKNVFFAQPTVSGATSTDGLVYQNTQAASAGTPVEYSPRARLQGNVWNTTATAANNQVDFINEVRPVSGLTPTAAIFWAYRLSTAGSGAFTDIMNVDGTGNLTTLGSIIAGKGYKTTLATQNTGATLTAAQMQTGVVCTSTAAVAYTTATATAIATQMGFTTNGSWYDWIVDNSASTSVGIITITLGTGLTAMTVITGENTLTVQIGVVAVFRFIFTSGTVAKVGRLI